MTANLMLCGGPTHPFTQTAPLVADLLGTVGIDTTIIWNAHEAITELRDGRHYDMVTVYALAWSMSQERYRDARAQHAVTLAEEELAVLDRHVREGGGLMAVHTAVICFDAHPIWQALCGATWNWERSSHPPLGPIEIRPTATGHHHVITEGVEPFVLDDEAYCNLDFAEPIEPLLVTDIDGQQQPLMWARSVGAGRVVTALLGHGPESLTHPQHESVMCRAARWVARQPDWSET